MRAVSGLLLERAFSRVTMMASTDSEMEIDEVAHNNSEKILKVAVNPATGNSGFHAHKIAFGLGLEGKQISTAVNFVVAVNMAFIELNASTRDQPVDRDRHWRDHRARRQDELRRQCPVPPQGRLTNRIIGDCPRAASAHPP
jgi:hypothetical protein